MKVPGIEEMVETFLSASVVALNPHGNVDPKAGLLAVLETHVKMLVFMAVLEGKKVNKGDGAKEALAHAEQHAEAIIAQLKEPRHD